MISLTSSSLSERARRNSQHDTDQRDQPFPPPAPRPSPLAPTGSSRCEDDTDDVEGYSCYSAWGMAAVAWFASFLLIAEGLTLAALILWKEDIFFVDGG